jgi:thiol-disulfide isomerase/thioredoxin
MRNWTGALAAGIGFAGMLVTVPAPARGEWPFPPMEAAPLSRIRAATMNLKGARAILMNMWATWCDPCREELPDLLRYYRDHRADGLRLVMVSADEVERQAEVRDVLRAAARAAGFRADFDAILFLKTDDDTAFVNGVDRRWSGALPATFLYSPGLDRIQSWFSPVTYGELERRVDGLLKPRQAPRPERH